MKTNGERLNRGATCIVVHARGCDVPRELADVLGRHGLQVNEYDCHYRALSALVRIASRSPGEPLSVLLIDPVSVEGAAELMQAAESYVPRAARWMYREGANPRLSRVVEEDVELWAGASGMARDMEAWTPRVETTPSLRLAGGIGGGDNPGRTTCTGEDSPASMLSSEEMAMLLGEDSDE